MGRPYQILLPLLSLFFVRVDLTDLTALELPVKVLKVMDGDTVLVRHNEMIWKVRLDKLDAPELKQPFLSGRKNAGTHSRDCLVKLLPQETILKITGHDLYGRVLGDLGEVSELLVKRGCSSLYPFARFSSQREKYRYLKFYRDARRRGVGIWGLGGIRQPKLWRAISKRSARRQWRR
jgi:micrococcal nuclease